MKAKEDYALAKEEIETGTATVLKGIVDEMLIPRWPQEFWVVKMPELGRYI